ncbi:hypothetical protein [Stenotrophomonas sp.]|uniref:hypothetical protein n=1 Tax=Stenotrophomonas sp. TaxID=69392 RepID=UPI0028ACC25C|nr:hypothetical protein [Stenotrophomonas sp.]
MNRALIHRRAQRLLPAGIETCGLLHFGMSPGQVEQVLLGSVFGDEAGQGMVALRLSLSTALAIRRKGLRYFEQGPWQFSAFAAALGPVQHDAGVVAPGQDALPARHAGGYSAVAADGRSWLVLLPVERLVIYGWWR